VIVRAHLKGLTLLVLPAVAWLFINATVNRHHHVTSDGHFFYHAHPYNKTSSVPAGPASHHHNDEDIILLSLLSDPAFSLILALGFFGIIQVGSRMFRTSLNHEEPAREYYQVYHYHAPPVF
jgi:hypothetical protein